MLRVRRKGLRLDTQRARRNGYPSRSARAVRGSLDAPRMLSGAALTLRARRKDSLQ